MTTPENKPANTLLRSFVDRIERLQLTRKTAEEDMSEVYKEARAAGFDVKVLKKLVTKRGQDSTQISEEDALLKLYATAVGDGA